MKHLWLKHFHSVFLVNSVWVGSLSLLQGIFLTQESSQGLLHCRRILYQLSSQGSPLLSGTRLKFLKAVSSIFIFFKSFLKAQLFFFPQRLWIFLFEPKSFLKVKFTQSCPTLCDPMDYTVHGILHTKILEWVALPFSNPGIKPRSPALQADSWLAEPQGKSKSFMSVL